MINLRLYKNFAWSNRGGCMVPSDHAKTAVSSCTRRITGALCFPTIFELMGSFLSTETRDVTANTLTLSCPSLLGPWSCPIWQCLRRGMYDSIVSLSLTVPKLPRPNSSSRLVSNNESGSSSKTIETSVEDFNTFVQFNTM